MRGIESAPKSNDGFTLLELLVSIFIIALLASLLVPALVTSKRKATQTVCAGNQRQLGIAFMLYLADNGDIFPTGAATSVKGAQPEDWIWWQTVRNASGQPAMRDAHASVLAPFLGNYNTHYFRCPADKDALNREAAWQANPSVEQYTYSYSLNAASERGMASYISKDRAMIFRNKHSSVARPSEKIMLAEEKGGPDDGPGSAVIDDGRWVPPGYPLTSRHAGHANVGFADGRVAAVRRDFADSQHPGHYDPEL